MRVLLATLFFLIGICSSYAQTNTPLFDELKKHDSIFFERGFNQCDLEYLEEHVATNLKFYHDQSGFQDRETFFKNVKENLCANTNKKPIRKLEEGSLTVYPLYNNGVLYAAIQIGTHHFYLRETGQPDVQTSSALFTHVWLKQNDTWVLSEALSYNHHSPTAQKQEDDKIELLLKENHVPALGLGIIKNGKLTTVKVYGTTDGQNTAPYNTIFKVASLTKPLTALITLKLIDDGALGLDEPLYKYWIDPDIETDKRYKKLTPRMVLSHQTGFPNWRYLNPTRKLTIDFEPGTKFQYSGEGFEYLRKAIEKKLESSIEELAKEYIFDDAQMNDTRFWWDAAMDTTRYAQNFDAQGKKIPTRKYYKANAAADLLTTVEDYGHFLTYLINGADLPEKLFKDMQTPQSTLGENDFFGLGWEILTGLPNEEYVLMHTGKDPGVSTLAVMFPKSKNGYVVFLNGDNVDKVYEYLLTHHLYLGQEIWDRR